LAASTGTPDAKADELVQVLCQLRLDLVGLGTQILQADQVALEDLQLVVEVLDAPVT
jgi:hypothetical protein